MQTSIETITPAKAQEYFNTTQMDDNKRFRPISRQYVHSYADTMKKGRWMLNGEPIVFDTDGILINGCHRMLAVVEAGIPVMFEVKRGVEPDAFTTYDNGRHRTLSQLLCMQGIKNYNLISSIVVANEKLVMTGRLFENNSSDAGGRKLTNDENYLKYRRDADGFDAVATYICKLYSRCRILSSSWAGATFYYLTHTGGYKPEEVEPFFEALFSLDSSDVVPANLLRKRITDASLQGKKLQAEMLFALLAKAWNAYITGVPIKRLSYDKDKERECPKFVLKALRK